MTRITITDEMIERAADALYGEERPLMARKVVGRILEAALGPHLERRKGERRNTDGSPWEEQEKAINKNWALGSFEELAHLEKSFGTKAKTAEPEITQAMIEADQRAYIENSNGLIVGPYEKSAVDVIYRAMEKARREAK